MAEVVPHRRDVRTEHQWDAAIAAFQAASDGNTLAASHWCSVRTSRRCGTTSAMGIPPWGDLSTTDHSVALFCWLLVAKSARNSRMFNLN